MSKNIYIMLGSWLFLIGIIIAFIVGLYQAYSLELGNNFFETNTGGWSAWILAIIGIIIGLFVFIGEGTVTKIELPVFMMAGTALVIMGGLFQELYKTSIPFIGASLAGITMSLSVLVAPAVGLISIKSIWNIGKER